MKEIISMHNIAIYQGNVQLRLPLPDGATLLVTLPGVAETDASFLRQWLFGKTLTDGDAG